MAFQAKSSILSISNSQEFDELALKLFRYQAQSNPVYKEYLQYLNVHASEINTIESIPFLPIE
ncbi:MAG: acyl transferase, partial [Flavobacteriales bacterium]